MAAASRVLAWAPIWAYDASVPLFLRVAIVMSRVAVALLSVGICIASNSAMAVEGYLFSTIHTTGSGSTTNLGEFPQLDEFGNVTFLRGTATANTLARGSGAPGMPVDLFPIGSVGGIKPYFGSNASGDVAFVAFDASGGHVYRTQAGVVEPIADAFSFSATINDSGLVAYWDHNSGLYSSADPMQPLFPIDPPTPLVHPLAIDSAGNIAFGLQGSLIEIVSPSGALTPVAESGAKFGSFRNTLDMNELNEVIFAARLNDGSALAGLFTWKAGSLTLIGNTTTTFAADTTTTAAINNLSDIVIRSTFLTGESGLFTGTDPVADKVIALGDSLEGSVVTSIKLGQGFNDAGQIAFWAQLADGRSGIFRADPIPEPSSIALAGIGTLLALLAYGARRHRPSLK